MGQPPPTFCYCCCCCFCCCSYYSSAAKYKNILLLLRSYIYFLSLLIFSVYFKRIFNTSNFFSCLSLSTNNKHTNETVGGSFFLFYFLVAFFIRSISLFLLKNGILHYYTIIHSRNESTTQHSTVQHPNG